MTDDLWLRDRLEELAREVGSTVWRLRLHGLDWQAERLQARTEVLMRAFVPTPRELVEMGVAEDAVDGLLGQEYARIDRLLGGLARVRPRERLRYAHANGDSGASGAVPPEPD